MNALTLERPSLFIATDQLVMVDDAEGWPFYYRTTKPGRTFRLPAGRFNVSGARYVRSLRERNVKPGRVELPERFDVSVGDNPHKASVWPSSGRILMDPSLKELPYTCRVFILLHEMGHLYHKGEEECDRFAASAMRRHGFNPSQISQASRLALSHHSHNRHKLNEHRARRMDRRTY